MKNGILRIYVNIQSPIQNCLLCDYNLNDYVYFWAPVDFGIYNATNLYLHLLSSTCLLESPIHRHLAACPHARFPENSITPLLNNPIMQKIRTDRIPLEPLTHELNGLYSISNNPITSHFFSTIPPSSPSPAIPFLTLLPRLPTFFLFSFPYYVYEKRLTAITTQAILTYGLNLSPTLAHFQNGPTR